MLLARYSKSAKQNTSDWKADWKNRVFWHCLIKLCCFSHQDCQQKVKHIASIQFPLQADTKWHSFASSLCYALFHLADPASWQGSTVHRAALPQGSGKCAAVLTPSAQEPREPLSLHGHGAVLGAGKFSPGKGQEHQATKAPAAVVCPEIPLQRASRAQPGFAQQPPLPARAQHFRGK